MKKKKKDEEKAYANFAVEKREIGMVLGGNNYLVALLIC